MLSCKKVAASCMHRGLNLHRAIAAGGAVQHALPRPMNSKGHRFGSSGPRKARFFMEQPFDVEANFMVGDSRETTNIFVLENIGSQCVMLNRPEANNAINLEMVQQLNKIYEELEDAWMTGLIILHGAGEKAFCAGGDVRWLYEGGMTPLNKPAPQMEFFRAEYTLNHRIAVAPKTSLALMEGYTMGGGVGLSANSQVRVALPDTQWAMPETAIGFFPDVGSSFYLPRTFHPNVGKYLGMTGRRLNAAECLELDIATHHIDFGMKHWMFDRLISVNRGLDNPDYVWDLMVPHHIDPEPEECPDNITPNLEAIAKCFAEESVEGITDALRQTHAGGGVSAEWAAETLGLLAKASPTSLAVTVEQMKRGGELKTLKECLEMEFRMARHMCAQPDFFEGVRAMIIDKDMNPKWAPAPHPDQVASYFEPLTADEELSITYQPRPPLSDEDSGGPRSLTAEEKERTRDMKQW
eukprot:CAMPEP_0181307676 /NCGR_PEP_ID=MMETSP1101-20121128/11021_1 /TAXON_ID=46948 /ORGANISM="Rhodomonas abbreviata, Strain Caron Lab Isolate" /LENGTH=466 /DNA_ID=CAMNT_0023413937 /DNA_START=35 /DNA_END=1432 /DNA_ORIENTATION=-